MNVRLTWAICMLLLQHVDHIGADDSQTEDIILTCPKKPELYFLLRQLK